MHRRFFLLGPPGLLIPRLFPERRGDKDDDGPRPPGPEDKEDMSDAPEFTPHGSLEAVPDVVDILIRDSTDVQIVNTTTETALFTYAVPAYMLDGDRGLRVTIKGAIKHNGTGTPTLQWRIKLGATTLYNDTSAALSALASEAPFVMTFNVMAKNSDALQEMDGLYSQGSRNAVTAGTGQISGSSVASAAIAGTSAEDGTTALDLQVTCQFSAAHADTWIEHRSSLVEHL